jgi:hypothetical protein
MEKKDVISLLHKIYVAGYVHGDNQGSFSEIGMFDAFNRLIVGESPLLDGDFYDIKDRVDDILSKFDSSKDEVKSSYSIDEVKILLEKQRELTASSLRISSAVYIYPKDYNEMKELMIKTPLVI